MIFKLDWEKTDVTHQLPKTIVEKMLGLAFPDKLLQSYSLIAGGCANLNFKVQFENEPNPFILRVYLRDKESVYKEQSLYKLLKDTVPVPQIYFIGVIETYQFAIIEFMPGITLRDFLIEYESYEIMQQVGLCFAKIANIHIPKNENLDILNFTKDCLKQLGAKLPQSSITKIHHYLDKYADLLIFKDDNHLVHGDFDPANILIHNVNGTWKISAILDWEFSFAGSYLFDVANMLRYKHKLPKEFESNFLQGLKAGGVELLSNWRIITHILNLINLLDLLVRSDSEICPNRFDIEELITYILLELDYIKSIEVVPYNPDWPKQFVKEAEKIKEALGDNCIDIHHIGSTSVPGLSAKPIIDIIVECKDNKDSIKPLETMNYEYRAEFNIPFRNYFCKKEKIRFNLHVYEQGNPEIELNLSFRDYLRNNPESRDEYALLKSNLLKEKSSFEKNNSIFTGYNLGKDQFIRKILQKLNLTALRIARCTHYAELEDAKALRQKYIFDQVGLQDPYLWTFEHQDHIHFVFYKGAEIIGYAHIQLWPKNRAALRIIAIDENYRNNGYGGEFLKLCEKWLRLQGYKSLHIESSPKAYSFYKKYGYIEMPFNDPEIHESDERDIPVGKIL